MAFRCCFHVLDRRCRARDGSKDNFFPTRVLGCRELHDAALDQQIQRLCEEGQLERAVEVLLRLDDLGISSSTEVYFCLVRACHKGKSLSCALQILEHLTTKLCHFNLPGPLADYLVITLAKCGGLQEAHTLFCSLRHRTVFSWTAMISGYVENGQASEALIFHERMKDDNVEPSHFTFVSLLKACGSLRDLKQGQKLHFLAKEKGIISNVYVANTLVGMYANCNSMTEAERVFSQSSSRDVVSWNVMLSAYLEQGHQSKALQLFRQMQDEFVAPDERTFVVILQVCSAVAEQSVDRPLVVEIVRGFHADISRCGFSSNVFVSNSLMCAYGKCGTMNEAETVFASLKEHSIVTWNAMLAMYIGQEHGSKGLQFFKYMHDKRVEPNERTFVSAIRACVNLIEKEDDSGMGKSSFKAISQNLAQALHLDIQRCRLAFDPFVVSALITLYSKHGMLTEAENAFNAVSQCTLILWSAMISAYVDQGHGEKALQLFSSMQEKSVALDKTALLISLQACCTLAEKNINSVDGTQNKQPLIIGQALHAEAILQGYALDVSISTILINLYSKCGFTIEAEKVFNYMPQHDAISWTAMLMAFLDQGQNEKALYLYDKLKDEQTMDDMLIVCVLQACRETGNSGTFWHLYFSVVSAGYESIPFLASCLIDTCGSCSSMTDGQEIFYHLTKPDLILWSAFVAGHACNGNYVACLKKVHEMLLIGISPDEVVILSLLTACSHSGHVDQGIEFFELLSSGYNLVPDIKHYVTMADLLGRAGSFRSLKDMLFKMPSDTDVSIWLCLLGACSTHNNLELGKLAFNQAIRLQPNAQTAYVLMSNVYTTDSVDEVDIFEKFCDEPLVVNK